MDVIDLWWLSLAIAAVVIVVVAVLLGLIVAAAKRIDRHAAAIWVAGKQIAGNTVSIWMLEDAIATLHRIAESAKGIDRTAASLDERLRALASARR